MEYILEFLEEYEVRRDYFQCHEILEEEWVRETNCETKNHPAIWLLQLSVALHHWRLGNYSGGRKLFQNVIETFPRLELEIEELGFRGKEIFEDVLLLHQEVNLKKPFHHLKLKLHSSLEEKYKALMKKKTR